MQDPCRYFFAPNGKKALTQLWGFHAPTEFMGRVQRGLYRGRCLKESLAYTQSAVVGCCRGARVECLHLLNGSEQFDLESFQVIRKRIHGFDLLLHGVDLVGNIRSFKAFKDQPEMVVPCLNG